MRNGALDQRVAAAPEPGPTTLSLTRPVLIALVTGIVQVHLGLLFFLAVREWRRRPQEGAEAEPPKLLGGIGSMSAPKIFDFGLAPA
ncbi:hypothetical protein [Streptomyces collinus]|uniref:hypothetical protein n=1 Tax=Streptomyces collinus TaxID=42684 RepID=UPI0003F79BA0|nr:hypothetical protein [Streptomyces collinus]